MRYHPHGGAWLIRMLVCKIQSLTLTRTCLSQTGTRSLLTFRFVRLLCEETQAKAIATPRLEPCPDYNAMWYKLQKASCAAVFLPHHSPPLPPFNNIKHKRGVCVTPHELRGETITLASHRCRNSEFHNVKRSHLGRTDVALASE